MLTSRRLTGVLAGWLLLCLLGVWGPVLAQSGSLRVRVLEASTGEALAGATVELASEQRLVAASVELTDTEGWAEFPVLPIGGSYVIDVSIPGFAGRHLAEVRVSSNETTERIVSLSEEVRERVEVSARRNVVDVDAIGNSTKLSDEFLESLPIPGRFYQNILTLAPGVKDSDKDGNPNVHGARFRDFKMEVGGVNNSDPLTGEWLSFVNTDSIEQMEIIDRGAGVEFGGKSGGFGRVLQKQGGNSFEATFSYLYRSSKFDGSGAGDLVQVESPEFEWNQPSAQLTGPLIRDKMWFRLSHGYIGRDDPYVFTTGSQVISRRQSINSDQLTWQVSPRNKLALQFSSDPLEIDNFGVNSRVPADSSQRLERGGSTYALTWSAPYSSKLFIESVVTYQDHETNLLPMRADATQDCAFFFEFEDRGTPLLNTSRCFNADTLRTSGSYPGETRDKRQRFAVQTQATFYQGRFLGSSHRLKAGMRVENERYFRDITRLPDLTFFTAVLNPFEGPVGFISAEVAAPRDSSGSATGTGWAIWLEDQMKPTPGLSITLGVRLDRREISLFGHEEFDPTAESHRFLELVDQGFLPDAAVRQSFTAFADVAGYRDELALALEIDPIRLSLGATTTNSTFWNQKRRSDNIALNMTDVAPRLAVAWDPWQDGKTKFFLTAGRYYGDVVLAVPLVEIEPPTATILFRLFQVGDEWLGFEPDAGFTPSASVHTLDRDLRTPYQDEFTLGFERALWLETSLKLTYIRRKYRDQLQDKDINHLTGDFGRCVISPSLGQPVVVVADEPGESYTDPYTGELFVDDVDGPGDGFIAPGFTEPLDDCTGRVQDTGGVFGYQFTIPDGLPDLYVQNPGWGEILQVGNFNSSDYEAFVLEVIRRHYRSWEMQGSYTWSKVTGDAEDFDQLLGNESNLVEDERGFLSFDQRHVAQLTAAATMKAGVRLGGTLRWQSGLPYSELRQQQTIFSRPPQYLNVGDPDQKFRFRYPSRQRNDQRNPSYWNLDLKLEKQFNLKRAGIMMLTLEIFNVFDDQTVSVEDRINGDGTGVRNFGRFYQLGLHWNF